MSRLGSKKKDKTKIHFIGHSTENVTGSMYLVEYKDEKTLLDCGFVQHRNKLTQWNMNNENYRFKVKEIDNIVISHFHLDHAFGLIRLYANGCRAKIFITKGSTEYLRIAMQDGFKITMKDYEYLKNTTGKKLHLPYTEEDIDKVLSHIIEVEYGDKVVLGEYTTLRLTSAYHIVGSAQVELYIRDKQSNYRKKIYYSGDLGNTKIDKPFLEPFSIVENADISIVESTYAMNIKPCTQKTRDKDREKLKVAVDETCLRDKAKLLIGSFAMNRAQELMYELYMIYGKDESFNIPIIVDSPLTDKITHMFDSLIPDKDIEVWTEIMSWDNIYFTKDWEDSEAVRKSNKPMIIISASGFLDAGRVRLWLQDILPNPSNRIVFVGYSDEGSLASEIKEGKKKYLNIDGLEIKNKARVLILNSFSSHIQHKEMLELYSSMNVGQIYLVHGEKSRQYEFAQLLTDKISSKNKTTKVFVPNMNDMIEV